MLVGSLISENLVGKKSYTRIYFCFFWWFWKVIQSNVKRNKRTPIYLFLFRHFSFVSFGFWLDLVFDLIWFRNTVVYKLTLWFIEKKKENGDFVWILMKALIYWFPILIYLLGFIIYFYFYFVVSVREAVKEKIFIRERGKKMSFQVFGRDYFFKITI